MYRNITPFRVLGCSGEVHHHSYIRWGQNGSKQLLPFVPLTFLPARRPWHIVFHLKDLLRQSCKKTSQRCSINHWTCFLLRLGPGFENNVIKTDVGFPFLTVRDDTYRNADGEVEAQTLGISALTNHIIPKICQIALIIDDINPVLNRQMMIGTSKIITKGREQKAAKIIARNRL